MCNSEEFGCREHWGIVFTTWESGVNDVMEMKLDVTLVHQFIHLITIVQMQGQVVVVLLPQQVLV